MYNKTDGAGWCFTAYCDSLCNTVKTSGPCVSTPAPPTPTTLTPTTLPTKPTKPTLSPPPPKDCSYLDPPRKVIRIYPIITYRTLLATLLCKSIFYV